MKMKSDLSGKVIVIKFDQQEGKKCYENSLKAKRGVFMVVERPPIEDDRAGVARAEKDRKFWFSHGFLFKTEKEKPGQVKHISRGSRKLVRWR